MGWQVHPSATSTAGSAREGGLELEVRELQAWAAQAGHLAREERQRQREAERVVAAELLQSLEPLTGKQRRAVVRFESCYRSWALAVASAERSERQASKDVDEAMEWAKLGCYIAERIEPWPMRLRTQGFCQGYLGNVHRVAGALQVSEREFGLAHEMWQSGEDPDKVLDPGRLLELEASLRSDLRQPAEALRLLAKAAPISRRPAYVLLTRGIILIDLGEYEEAVAVLLDADDPIESQGEPRLKNVQQFSLCGALCHLNRYGEAAELLPEVRRSASRLGDRLDLYRVLWIDARIARGLGERERALVALEAAAAAFDGCEMFYDAALARFEVAALHLEMGYPERSAEIAGQLVERFTGCGDYEEAKKALQLFVDAIAAQRATIELASSILRFLFLAQHQALVFRET